ncbi:MAG TPA: CapA family protein [Candidatus Dormibacteraeota bacterium]|nr:CapA family protein [Candidatus Dormibacteraeota bacterium]
MAVRRGTVLAGFCGLLVACSSPAPSPSPSGGSAPVGASSAAPSPTPVPTAAPTPAPLPDVQPLSIYSGAAPSFPGVDPSRLRLMVVTGDMIPARQTGHLIRVRGDWTYPLAATRDILAAGDVTFANLESPLLPSCPDIVTGFTFCADARFAAALQGAGVDVVNVANNHSTNQGQSGLDQTVQVLQSHAMQVSGFQRVVSVDVRGVRFGFVGINLVGNHLDAAAMQQLVAEARSRADVVVVQFHWGHEYETYPQPAAGVAPDDPKTVGRLAVDAGADIVIGNHPHCVQGSEMYKGHLITYAHGNFIFDQNWSVGTQEGVIGRYWFDGTRLVGVQYVPVRINGDVQPRPLDAAAGEGRAILDRMLRSSRELLGMSKPLLDGPGINDACP